MHIKDKRDISFVIIMATLALIASLMFNYEYTQYKDSSTNEQNYFEWKKLHRN